MDAAARGARLPAHRHHLRVKFFFNGEPCDKSAFIKVESIILRIIRFKTWYQSSEIMESVLFFFVVVVFLRSRSTLIQYENNLCLSQCPRRGHVDENQFKEIAPSSGLKTHLCPETHWPEH